jgi:hypothetical protein
VVVRLESVSLRANPVVRAITYLPGSHLPTDQSAGGRFTSMVSAHGGNANWPNWFSAYKVASGLGGSYDRERYSMRSPPEPFPDYELPDHTRILRRPSDLQGEDPFILTLTRGHYCPKDHQQHLELAAFYPKIAVAYTQIATISTDDHHTLQEFRASLGAEWTFLSDADRTV